MGKMGGLGCQPLGTTVPDLDHPLLGGQRYVNTETRDILFTLAGLYKAQSKHNHV